MQPLTGPGAPSSAATAGASQRDNRRIEKSSRDFESLLLSNWLEKAYNNMGSVPGADEDGELDSGNDQLSSIAMQALAQAMTASGGIGIAKMISNHLHNHAETEPSVPPAAEHLKELQRFSPAEAELYPPSGR